MATIRRAAFAVSWTTTYPSTLSGGAGLTTRAGHGALFRGDATLGRPWDTDTSGTRWSRFWSSYLRKPKRLGDLGPDSAWENVIPFLRRPRAVLTGPDGVEATARVLVYPSAISVVLEARATGSWALADLAAGLAALRDGKDWGATPTEPANRSLDGIATDLRDEAAGLLTAAGVTAEPESETVLTAAAPIDGDGDPDEYDLGDATARSCLAGLASLGPPGTMDDARLIGVNSDANFQARIYVLRKGHAIWRPQFVLAPPANDPLGCLLRNQTDTVTHIAALEGIVRWAGDRIAAGVEVPIAVRPLVGLAALRLRQLHTGDDRKTYRSGVAKVRVEPLLPVLATIDAQL